MPGPRGPIGIAGVQGPPGTVGDLWAAQPTPAELARDLRAAVTDVDLRTFLDPRASTAYLTTVATRLVRWQGHLLLRVVLQADPETAADSPAGLRSIA